MNIFSQLTKIRDFEKKHFPFLLTIEDFDIVRVIGLRQESMKPILLKQLFLEGIGSYATITRRLRMLREREVVLAESHEVDRRSIVLSLSPAVMKSYARYGLLLVAGKE